MQNPLLLGPIFIPLAVAALTILFARQRRIQQGLGLGAGIVAWLSSIGVLVTNVQGEISTYQLGGWEPPFGIVLVGDMLSSVFAVMSTTVLLLGIVYSLGCKDKSVAEPIYMPLFLSMSAGLAGALYTGDMFTLFVFIELMVISSVILVALSDNRYGLEAAIKYLFISAMGTLFLLTGVAALYASFGTLNIADIGRSLASGNRPLLTQAAAVMLMCAFLLKSAVFPFHFWQPDFHTTAPTPVGAMLSSVVVKVGVYSLIRVITVLFTGEASIIQEILIILGIVGIFFGSLGALRTHDAKRLLAYSTFGQIGFILVGIGWGTAFALTAAIVYAVNHAFIKSSMLMLTGVVASRTNPKTAELAKLVGVGKSLTLTGGLYFLGALALSGVPPLNGFVSKLALVQSGIAIEDWAIVGLVVGAGILTLLYMSRTWQLIFQRALPEETPVKSTGDSQLAPFILIVACVLLGLFGGYLLDLAELTVAQLANSQIYIQAVLGG